MWTVSWLHPLLSEVLRAVGQRRLIIAFYHGALWCPVWHTNWEIKKQGSSECFMCVGWYQWMGGRLKVGLKLGHVWNYLWTLSTHLSLPLIFWSTLGGHKGIIGFCNAYWGNKNWFSQLLYGTLGQDELRQSLHPPPPPPPQKKKKKK